MKTIDTFNIAKKAQAAGFNAKQTEFFVHTVNTIEETHISNLATKNDLLLVEEKLRNEIHSVKKDLKNEISGNRKELKNEISGNKKDFENKIISLENRLLIKLTIIVTLIMGVFKFINF